MSDLETALGHLPGHTISLCRGTEILTDSKRGVAPMVGFIESGANLNGFSVADLVVGRAAAMLFVKAGIRQVYAITLSRGAKEYLEAHGIPVRYETLTDKILNRDKTGICPMEDAVTGLDDAEDGWKAICARLAALRAAH